MSVWVERLKGTYFQWESLQLAKSSSLPRILFSKRKFGIASTVFEILFHGNNVFSPHFFASFHTGNSPCFVSNCNMVWEINQLPTHKEWELWKRRGKMFIVGSNTELVKMTAVVMRTMHWALGTYIHQAWWEARRQNVHWANWYGT